jgi:hypothetical protein
VRQLRRVAAASTCAAVALVALLAGANAPPDQYLPFGPQAQTIQDQHTNLVWQRWLSAPDASPAKVDHATAVSQCALRSQRLPTYRELLSIVDEDPHFEWDPVMGQSTARFIDPNAFPGTPGDEFWTMSPGTGLGFKVVNFRTGTTNDEGNTAYVRCVSP